MRAAGFLAAAFVAFFVLPALAQNAPATPSVRIRGTLTSSTAQTDHKTARRQAGDDRSGADFTVVGVVKKSLADIKAGDYVASTSLKERDGKLQGGRGAHLSENMRGAAEGQFPGI